MDPQVNGGVGGGNGSPNITESSSDGASMASMSRESSSNSISTPSMIRAESSITLPVSKDRSTAEAKALNRRSLSAEKLKFMKPLKKQDPPISKELSDRARSAPLVKKFALPPTETLINDYSAALLKHILIHGRMYVSQNYICFESKIFGIKTMEVIPFRDIVILSKKSKKLKFAHGIEVGTTAQTYYFASFVSRTRAFETLIKIWREHVPKDPQNLDDDDYSDDDDDGTQDYESDDSSLKKKDKKTAKEHPEELKLGRSVESQPGEYEERERERDKDRERGLRRFSSPLLSRVLPKHSSASSASTSSLNDPKESTSSSPNKGYSTNTASPLSASSNLTNPNNNANNNNNNTNTASTASSETPVPSPHESEDEEDTNYDSGDGFLGMEATYQPVVNATFGVNVKTFFKIFFSDESNFTSTYHAARNDKDMVVKKWTNSPQFGYIRDVHFLSPVKVPLGPSHTRIIETQRYHLTKNRLLIDTISVMLDIPYGDCFRVEGKWDITSQTPETCKLVISVGVHFMKKTWFKGKIESQSIKETRESYQQWASMAPSEITKYKASNPISQPSSTAASPMLPARNGVTPSSNASSTSATTISATTTTITSQSLSSSSVSTSSVSSVENVSLEPSVSLEGSRRTSYAVDGGKFARATNLFSSISSPLQGQSIASVAWFIVFGFIFMQMYLRIAHLEGQVATLETILQPVLAKQLKDL